LHVISDRRFGDAARFIEVAARVCAVGVDAVHLRDREQPAGEMVETIRRLRDGLDDAGSDCRVIVNDRVDIAAVAWADGVQLPEHGISPRQARTLLPDPCLVGVSVHSVEAAMNAESEGADYVLAGHIFETGSKPGAPGRGIDFLRAVVAAVDIPIVAIGGIDTSNARAVMESGAHGLAVISAILGADDPARVAAELHEIIDAVRLES
jgi:thiamine-phosphate diphosphorylase